MITREVQKFLRRRVLASPYVWQCPNESKDDAKRACANLIVVSHEATLTGAPKIILGLLRELSQSPKLKCTTVLHNDGILLDQFAEYSKVYCLEVSRKKSNYLQRMVDKIISKNCSRAIPTIALVNSAESRFIAESIAHRGIPVISLIHELPNSYSESDFQQIATHSNHVVFPAEFVKNAATSFTRFTHTQTHVIPQGLLDPQFGTRWDRQRAKAQLKAESGIPIDSRLVVGCGSLDLRKGIDYFVNVARIFCQKYGHIKDTHFCWIGDGPRFRHSPFHYLTLDMKRSGIQHRVHFVGQRLDVEPYFTAADAALMVSRDDPFPCVVHEAMSCGVPTIAFQDAGGAPEALADASGIVIPYGDCEAAAFELHRLQTIPEYAETISNKAQQRIGTHFSFVNYANQIGRLIEETANLPLGFGTTNRYLRHAA